MSFEAVIGKQYRHSVAEVWRALTRPEALSKWLMEVRHFVPEIGCSFELHCRREDGSIDVYHCRILELSPPHRMVWSWLLAGADPQQAMQVSFDLLETDSGCELRIRHAGGEDPESMKRFESGWPERMDDMERLLSETSTGSTQ